MVVGMESQRFVRPPQGRFAIGCASIFLAAPAFGTSYNLWNEGVLWAVPLPALALFAALGAVYYWFNEEVVATLDGQGLRLSRARVILGMRLAETVDWSIPRAALTQARQVTTKTPAKNGGWNTSTRLQLPEGRTLDATTLGGDEDSQSAYSELARALKKQLGSAFEVTTTS